MSDAEIEFLDVEDVLEIHQTQLSFFGGLDGVRSMVALEAAVAVPQSSFGGEHLHADIYEMAAAYAYHIAESQAFIDGNKRTGLHAALSFLRLNGVLTLDPEDRLGDAMIQIAEKRIDKAILASIFRSLVEPTE